MLVPASMEKLDEADASLGKAAGQQTVGYKRAGLFGILSIKLKDMLRFFRKVRQLRNGTLHPKCHFVLRDSCGNLRVTKFLELHVVELTQGVQVLAPQAGIEPRRIR